MESLLTQLLSLLQPFDLKALFSKYKNISRFFCWQDTVLFMNLLDGIDIYRETYRRNIASEFRDKLVITASGDNFITVSL